MLWPHAANEAATRSLLMEATMPNNPRTLNVHVDWRRLLDVVGVPTQWEGLPTVTRCPVCHDGSLHIYDDHALGGQWHSCQRCGSGDMIHLAAKAWHNSNVKSVVERLAREGFSVPTDPEVILRYYHHQVAYRQRIADLWTRSRDRYIQRSGGLNTLLYRLGAVCDIPEQRWASGPGLLMGGMDTASVERAFAPRAMKHADRLGQRNNPSQDAIFRGPGWREALVIPHYDLPWRICAFLFIGREGNPPNDFVVKRLNLEFPGNEKSQEPFEGGLAMHPRTLESAGDWNRQLIAVSDPFLALRLQMRHFRNHLHPLPLVAWQDRPPDPNRKQRRPLRTVHAWQIVGNRKTIFWMPRMDIATIRQAVRTDGLISTVGPRWVDEASLKEYVWKEEPQNLLRHVQKAAKPWHAVLGHLIEKSFEADVEKLLLGLETKDDDVEQILRACGQKARNRALTVAPSPAALHCENRGGRRSRLRRSRLLCRGRAV